MQTATQFVLPIPHNIRVNHIDTAYLSNCFLISHYCLFDETVHFDIPIAARNDHPGSSKAHGDFHSSWYSLLFQWKRSFCCYFGLWFFISCLWRYKNCIQDTRDVRKSSFLHGKGTHVRISDHLFSVREYNRDDSSILFLRLAVGLGLGLPTPVNVRMVCLSKVRQLNFWTAVKCISWTTYFSFRGHSILLHINHRHTSFKITRKQLKKKKTRPKTANESFHIAAVGVEWNSLCVQVALELSLLLYEISRLFLSSSSSSWLLG